MYQSIKNVAFLLTSLSFLLYGCASQTRPFIPTDIPPINKDEARIIFTRENQIAGAISPIIIIDIGDNIEPNAFIYMRGLDVEDILKGENIASIAGVFIDFMWFNPNRVKPLYCKAVDSSCITYNNRWPKKNVNNFLFGSAALVKYSCQISYEHDNYSNTSKNLFDGKLETINLSDQSTCKIIRDGSLFLDISSMDIQVFHVPESDGYFLPYATPISIKSGLIENIDNLVTSMAKKRTLSKNAQVIGSTEVGDTLIWDRRPGVMRLGSVWHDGVGFMPKNINVEAGKTYFVHYTTRLGQRWELKKIE